MDDVYVVQIASTGPKGMPSEAVAEIAVCRMLADGSDFDTILSETVSIDPLDLGKDSLDWLSSSYGINPEDLYAGEDRDVVVKRVQEALYGKECTSYNVNNVFGKYLCFEPWDCTGELTLLPSVSGRLPAELRGPAEREHELIRLAYDSLCPGDPACVGKGSRAIQLAQMSASVMMALRTRGLL